VWRPPAALRRGAGTWLFVLPALAVYGIFFLWPLVQLLQLSLVRWDGLGEKEFVGLDNYRRALDDHAFWEAFQHNVEWMFAAMVVPTTIALVIAIVLARAPLKGRTAYRTLLFLPQILSSVVVAIVWGWFYNPYYGALNRTLTSVGLPAQDWLGNPSLALGSLFAVWTWVSYGFAMVVFLAALQTIDEEYFDAAKVDGAGKLQQFRHILLPAIRRPVSVVVLVTAIGAFQVFDLVFIMTNGGPIGATNVLTLYMYNNAFVDSQIGYGSAIATILGGIILLCSLVFLRLRRVTESDW
jgi:raffinose/stachyose/melibiose transport system permease protein